MRRGDVSSLEDVRRIGLDRLARPEREAEQAGEVRRRVLGFGLILAKNLDERGVEHRAGLLLRRREREPEN